jgi:hypothetical protein
VLSSEVAELRALLHAVEGASAQEVDIVVKLDNQFVSDTAALMLAGSSTWPACGHHLWERLSLAQKSQLAAGGCGHKVCWVKGHATALGVSLGFITMEEKAGNFEADRLASLAATMARCPKDLLELAGKKPAQAEFVQRFLVEVLLARQLFLIEQRRTLAQEAHPEALVPSCVPSPLCANIDAAAILATFLGVHGY